MKYLYFGHSRMLYGTKEEKLAFKLLKKLFPDYEIIDPSLEEHQINCRKTLGVNYKPGKEIGYFLKLTDLAEFGCFLQYYPKTWSAGSATEVRYMLKAEKEVFLINLETEELESITEDVESFTFAETSKKLGEAGIKRFM